MLSIHIPEGFNHDLSYVKYFITTALHNNKSSKFLQEDCIEWLNGFDDLCIFNAYFSTEDIFGLITHLDISESNNTDIKLIIDDYQPIDLVTKLKYKGIIKINTRY